MPYFWYHLGENGQNILYRHKPLSLHEEIERLSVVYKKIIDPMEDSGILVDPFERGLLDMITHLRINYMCLQFKDGIGTRIATVEELVYSIVVRLRLGGFFGNHSWMSAWDIVGGHQFKLTGNIKPRDFSHSYE